MKITLLTVLVIFSFKLQASTLKEQLEQKGATCNHKLVTSCTFPKNTFGYPNKTIFIFKQDVQKKDLIFYFHGHSFGALSTGEDFDSTPQKMINSFNFDKAMDKLNSSILVIPYTIKKCQDYDYYLSSPQNFKSYIENIQNITDKNLGLHLTAHSGAGRTLAKVINQIETKIHSISLFDALYNPSLTAKFNKWAKLNNKRLNLLALAHAKASLVLKENTGPTPFMESKKIFQQFSADIEDTAMSEFTNSQGASLYLYRHHKKDNNTSVYFYYQEKKNFIDHWYLVKDHFTRVFSKTLN